MNLDEKICEKCGAAAVQVIKYVEAEGQRPKPVRAGWYCPECKHWEKAILRETVVCQEI